MVHILLISLLSKQCWTNSCTGLIEVWNVITRGQKKDQNNALFLLMITLNDAYNLISYALYFQFNILRKF
jgi:hypothetical protein